jgi:two-component system, cell cycle sensor histidine kinase and response regulator CckA
VNQTLCEFLGYPRQELVQKTWAELTHPDDVSADVAEFERVMRGESDGYKMDKRFIRKDGTTVYATIDVKCERRADGSVDRFLATVADITQRKAAESALRESLDLLTGLARQVPGVIYQFRLYPDGRSCFPFASDAMHDIYEVSPQEVREDATIVYQRLHPDDYEMVRASIAHSAQSLEPWRCEYRVVLPRQGVRWRSGVARPERLADGSILWHGFISDSTAPREAQRDAQRQLEESEERYRVLIESAPEAIVVLDADSGHFAEANANALALFGMERAQLLEKSPADVSPPVQPDGRASSEVAREQVARALQGECPVFEWTHRSSDGRDIPTEIRLVQLPSSSRRLVRGSITDISERQSADQELRRLKAAIASSINGIATADLDGQLTYVNQAFLDLWGYRDAGEVLGRNATEFWMDPARAAQVVHALRTRGSDVGEMLAVRRDGSQRHLQYNANIFPGPRGLPAGLLASFVDITEQKRTLEELRLKDKAIETSLNAVMIADASATIEYANPACARLWGYPSSEQVVGKPAADFLAAGAVQSIVAHLLASGTWQGELEARRLDGTTMSILISANAVRDDEGKVVHLMASIADITEAKRLQVQLTQSQKMQSVGRLAGGVAHDFNNLLTVMKGYVELARHDVPAGSALADDLGAVNRAIDSAAALTQQLLTFSRKQIIHPRVLNLNESVTRMHGMLGRVLGEDIELRLVTAPDLWLVRFDPYQSEQILVNLAVNARDAMPDGGRLTIETANVVLDAEYARTHPDAAPGDYIMLAVSDTGTGMTPEVQAHLFEPFFTTKEAGRGTGLGLAMVYGAVTQNGGRIQVYSDLGHGTTFRIFLPRVREEATPAPDAEPSPLPRGGETIVVVEDDDAIRALTQRLLSGLGYKVRAYRSGADALHAIQSMPESIDLVVTDVIMPEMKGSELAQRLQQLRPGLRILFASGYSEDVIAHHGVLDPGVDFLQKPYSIEELARRVREVLDRSAAADVP